jgi:hypothetical protein
LKKYFFEDTLKAPKVKIATVIDVYILPKASDRCGEQASRRFPGKAFAILPGKSGMKQHSFLWLSIVALAITLSSCEVIGGIFKAGFWTAIILIVLVVGLILWLVGRSRR